MNGSFHLEDFGQTIGLEKAVAYLESRGWKTSREEDRGQIWFESPSDSQDDSIHLYLPVSEEYADYPARLEELVKAVSIFEQRPAIHTVIEMAAARHGDTPRVESLAGDIEEIIKDELRQMEGTISVEKANELLDRLPPLMRNTELVALMADGLKELPVMPKYVVQGAAILAASLAKILPDSDEWGLFLWRVVSRLMGKVGLLLRWIPSQLDEFLVLARSEETATPDSLFEWLTANSTPIARQPRREILEQ